MLVTIPRITEHAGYPGNVLTIEISDNCPVCGGPRGEVFKTISYDGSRRLWVDGWENPCGHLDVYSKVREEYFNQSKMKNAYNVDDFKQGDKVKYVAPHQNINDHDVERGIVKRITHAGVFVNFYRHGELQETAQLCNPANLIFD